VEELAGMQALRLTGDRFGGTLIGYGGAAVEEAAGGEEFGVEEGSSGGAAN